jgi:hypothetical protein
MEGGSVRMTTRPPGTARRALGGLICLAVAVGAVVASCGVHQHRTADTPPDTPTPASTSSAGPVSPATSGTPGRIAGGPASSTPTATPTVTGPGPATPPGGASGAPTGPASAPWPRSARPANPVPAPTSASTATASGAALGAVRAWTSSDTDVDHDPADTARRAAAWLTADLAAALSAADPTGSPGASWTSWERHHAYLRVAVALSGDDHPADTATSAIREVLVQAVPVGRDGWRGSPVRQVEMVTLQHTGHGWRAADIRGL